MIILNSKIVINRFLPRSTGGIVRTKEVIFKKILQDMNERDPTERRPPW